MKQKASSRIPLKKRKISDFEPLDPDPLIHLKPTREEINEFNAARGRDKNDLLWLKNNPKSELSNEDLEFFYNLLETKKRTKKRAKKSRFSTPKRVLPQQPRNPPTAYARLIAQRLSKSGAPVGRAPVGRAPVDRAPVDRPRRQKVDNQTDLEWLKEHPDAELSDHDIDNFWNTE